MEIGSLNRGYPIIYCEKRTFVISYIRGFVIFFSLALVFQTFPASTSVMNLRPSASPNSADILPFGVQLSFHCFLPLAFVSVSTPVVWFSQWLLDRTKLPRLRLLFKLAFFRIRKNFLWVLYVKYEQTGQLISWIKLIHLLKVKLRRLFCHMSQKCKILSVFFQRCVSDRQWKEYFRKIRLGHIHRKFLFHLRYNYRKFF